MNKITSTTLELTSALKKARLFDNTLEDIWCTLNRANALRRRSLGRALKASEKCRVRTWTAKGLFTLFFPVSPDENLYVANV
jgi:hypothetical protein